MCPCHGIAVTQAQVSMDLGEFFSHENNQAALVTFLESQGVDIARTSWGVCWWPRPDGIALSTGSLWTGVGFLGNQIVISDEGRNHPHDAYQAHKVMVDKSYALSFLFVGQQIQAGIIKTLSEADLNPRDFKQLEGGAIEIRADLSPSPITANTLLKETVRVQIGLDGTTKLITENGTVEVGKKKLQLFMALLGQRSGMNVQPSGEFESHRHDEDQVRQRLDAWQ